MIATKYERDQEKQEQLLNKDVATDSRSNSDDNNVSVNEENETQTPILKILLLQNASCIMYCLMGVLGKVLMNGYGQTSLEWSFCRQSLCTVLVFIFLKIQKV